MARTKRETELLRRLINLAFTGIPTRLGKPAKIRGTSVVRRKAVGVFTKKSRSSTATIRK